MNKLLFSLISLFLCGCVSSQHKARVLDEFNTANILPPNSETIEDDEWKYNIELPNADVVEIHAQSGFGFARCTYSNDETVTVFKYMDYMYVNELRLSSDSSILYVKVSGLSPSFSTNWKQVWIYVFDLQNRKRLFRIEQ